ncbi:MAG: (Fe-S)-binding protein [Deferribacterales bacterium]|jgi:Fe-S oxidoreductase
MKKLFAPGCAMLIYKPELAEKINNTLGDKYHTEGLYDTCCHHRPETDEPLEIVNTCPGCDRRYSSLYKGVSTISLWEILASDETFPLPDYKGAVMSVHDACPTRKNTKVHDAIRTLAERMNIIIKEPARTRTNAVCCGDTFYGKLPAEEVTAKMKERADEMPCEDVIVYCVSCVHAMQKGGKKAHYMPDLLFGEQTSVKPETTEEWHGKIEAFIETH